MTPSHCSGSAAAQDSRRFFQGWGFRGKTMDESCERKSKPPKPSPQLPSPSWLCCLCFAQSSDHQKILQNFLFFYLFSPLVAPVVPSVCCY